MLQCSICWAFPALKRLRLNPCVKEKAGHRHAEHSIGPACNPATHKTSIDRDRGADSFQIHKQLPLWWVSTETHAAVRTCGWRVHVRQRSWSAVQPEPPLFMHQILTSLALLKEANNPRWSWHRATWLVKASTSCTLNHLQVNTQDINAHLKFHWVN